MPDACTYMRFIAAYNRDSDRDIDQLGNALEITVWEPRVDHNTDGALALSVVRKIHSTHALRNSTTDATEDRS